MRKVLILKKLNLVLILHVWYLSIIFVKFINDFFLKVMININNKKIENQQKIARERKITLYWINGIKSL